MPVRVLLAGSVLGRGGIQTHLRWLSKALSELGVRVLVLSLSEGEQNSGDVSNLRAICGPQVQIAFCHPTKNAVLPAEGVWSKINRFNQVRKTINQFRPNVYVAVGTGWNLFLPVQFCQPRPRLIFHEVMSGISQGRKDTRWIVRWLFDEVLGQADPVTSAFKDSFGWHGPSATLPAMPEPLEVTARILPVKRRTVPKGHAKAAFLGRLAPHKNALWLVRQWEYLKDVLQELHIYGTGPEQEEIEKYIVTHGISDRVCCLGAYPDGQEYADLIARYDLVLLPTLGAEGAPLVLLEAMACGVPFVAYGVGGIPDYGRDNPDVIVVPPEGGAFVQHVCAMAANLASGRIDQERLQRYYFRNYSYERLKREWFTHLSTASGNWSNQPQALDE